jgi:DNA-binding MarR family transcriptional regulator
MGYVIVNKLQPITPLLGKHDLNTNHFAMMHAIGMRENDQRVAEVKAEKYTEFNSSGLRAWCFAGERRLARDWSLSVKTAHRALAWLEEKGFIECRAHSKRRKAFYRRVNLKKIDELLQELPAFEAAYEMSFGREGSQKELDGAPELCEKGQVVQPKRKSEANDEETASQDNEAAAVSEKLGGSPEEPEYDVTEEPAALFFQLLGKPPDLKDKVANWRKRFVPLENEYGRELVWGSVFGALHTPYDKPFWKPLFLKQADPMKYMEKKMPILVDQCNAEERRLRACVWRQLIFPVTDNHNSR